MTMAARNGKKVSEEKQLYFDHKKEAGRMMKVEDGQTPGDSEGRGGLACCSAAESRT